MGEVLEIIRVYAPHTSPQQMVALPLPDQSGAVQLRSLEQILIQDIDLFGRPTKRLYARLAPYATDSTQEALLRELGEGTAEENFRQRSDESMTIAEVLLEFTSARPSWPELVEIVGTIKPRHYSIASSMNMHPDSVHLLVVDHTWVTPQGKLRRGQCTRYLQGLHKGDTVTVSVKPSIMKLPASHSTPKRGKRSAFLPAMGAIVDDHNPLTGPSDYSDVAELVPDHKASLPVHQ